MVTNLKALLVVLVLAITMFTVAKPICLRYMQEGDFIRRRNVWLALTTVAFASPSFWIYVLVAVPLIIWAARKDNNPVALYLLLLHVIPPVSMELPPPLINKLFELDNYRILALTILMPMAWRLLHTKDKRAFGNNKMADCFMLAFVFVQLVAYIPYEDVTNTLRRAVLLVMDFVVLFYVVSRCFRDREALIEAIAAFTLALAILAPIAVFESQRGWLLYQGLGAAWGVSFDDVYLLRGDSLRAQVSAGHSLLLGYLFSMAFGFWLFLSSPLKSIWQRLLGSLGIWMALIAAYSRAPWLVAALVFLCYQALNPNGLMKLAKTLLVLVPVAGVLLISPAGKTIVDNLPFIGSVDASNVDYRQQLAESSWERIKEYPLFGDAFFMTHLEHLRQGQGIIDLVNVYATVAMETGVVGLLLFLGPFLIGVAKVWRSLGEAPTNAIDHSRLGACLLACMVGTAFFMATCSFYLGLSRAYYVLAGFAMAYAHLNVRTITMSTNTYLTRQIA